MELIELFEELAKIPSPSLGEINVSNKILEFTYNNGINAYYDNYQNLIVKVEANCDNKKPLLLSAHMDVVGNSSPVNIRYSEDNKFIETDKTRTLGADDKAGVSVALYLAKYLTNHPEIKHGGLEIVLTRDEETSMSGINHVEFDKLESENVLVLDSDSLGNFEIAGAGYTKLDIEVNTKLGGHSGNDIQDKKDFLKELPLKTKRNKVSFNETLEQYANEYNEYKEEKHRKSGVRRKKVAKSFGSHGKSRTVG